MGQSRFKTVSGYIILAGAAFLLVILFRRAGIGYGKAPVVGNVHYVDSAGANFLFRGGLPQTGKPSVFNYTGLKRAIADAGKRAGLPVPAAYYLLDVNLLNIENPADAGRIVTEYQFFKRRPQLGLIQVWGMTGTGISPTGPNLIACRGSLARNLDSWLSDRLVTRVELLRKWLTGPPLIRENKSLPVVIYVHCVAGCDRTGELIGAYYLRYLHKSWEEMNELNRSMCRHNRPFGCKNYRATQWYALRLALEHGTPLKWYQEFPCSGK